MRTFALVLALFSVALSVDVWTTLVDEDGLEYEGTAAQGLEFSTWNSQRGGNGGGAWADDCQNLGGLKEIKMQCGHFVGSAQLVCGKRAMHKRGAGRGHGSAGVSKISGKGITKVIINAGSYVDKVRFYRGNSKALDCGRSRGGRAYTANAPKGMQLCGMRGRAGWWMDKLSMGWCKKPAKKGCCCRIFQHCDFKGYSRCIDADRKRTQDNDQYSSIKVAPGCQCTVFEHYNYGGAKWTITESTSGNAKKCFTKPVMKIVKKKHTKVWYTSKSYTWNDHISSVKVTKTKRHCKQTSWKCKACNKNNGRKTCTRAVSHKALHGGNGCGPAESVKTCRVNCEVKGYGGWSRCSGYKRSRQRGIRYRSRNGGSACNVGKQTQCCEMGHRCTKRGHSRSNQCCGSRCCSYWGWCGGSRNGRYDAWCRWSRFDFMNHVAGFHSEAGDISVGLTGAFAAVIFLPSFAVYQFFSRKSQGAEYEALLDNEP